MSKQMLELAEELREYTAMKYAGDCKCGKCQLVPRRLVERIYHALNSTAIRSSADSAQDVPGLVQDLPLIWQGWCNAIRLMEDKATIRHSENAAQAAAYEQCAKDLKEALTRPSRTEPQAASTEAAVELVEALNDIEISAYNAAKFRIGKVLALLTGEPQCQAGSVK